MKKWSTKASKHRLSAFGFFGIVSVILLQVLVLSYKEKQAENLHSASSTYVVCHAKPKNDDKRAERYYCSSRGCYSDEIFEMRIIGTYTEKEMCVGMADSFGK